MREYLAGRPDRRGLRSCTFTVIALFQAIYSGQTLAAEYSVKASVEVRETYSDNVNLAPAGSQRSSLVTQVVPRLSVNSTGGGRIRLNFDAGLDGALYAGGTGATANSRTNVRLGANATIEAIENFFFVDAKYTVQQANLSQFSAQSANSVNVNANSTEVRTYSVSPYFRGIFPGQIRYLLRYTETGTDSDATQVGSPTTRIWSANFSQPTALGPLGWAYDYTKNGSTTSRGLDNETASSRLTITYQVHSGLSVFARAGRETNNYSLTSQSSTTRGFGFDWKISPRTSVNGSRDTRFFGTSYAFNLNHRFPQSAFSAGLSRNITTSADTQLLGIGTITLPSAFQAIANDPALTRAFLTQFLPPAQADLIASLSDDQARAQLLLLLVNSGVAQLGTAQLPFLTQRIVVSKFANVSYSIHGKRNNVVLTAIRSTTESATSGQLIADDLNGATAIDSRTYSATWSHSLTPNSSMGATVTQTKSQAHGGNGQTTRLRLFNVFYTSRLGARTTGNVTLRHQDFDSTTDYKENAVIGTLNYSF